jgi:hypothetical protein
MFNNPPCIVRTPKSAVSIDADKCQRLAAVGSNGPSRRFAGDQQDLGIDLRHRGVLRDDGHAQPIGDGRRVRPRVDDVMPVFLRLLPCAPGGGRGRHGSGSQRKNGQDLFGMERML